MFLNKLNFNVQNELIEIKKKSCLTIDDNNDKLILLTQSNDNHENDNHNEKANEIENENNAMMANNKEKKKSNVIENNFSIVRMETDGNDRKAKDKEEESLSDSSNLSDTSDSDSEGLFGVHEETRTHTPDVDDICAIGTSNNENKDSGNHLKQIQAALEEIFFAAPCLPDLMFDFVTILQQILNNCDC